MAVLPRLVSPLPPRSPAHSVVRAVVVPLLSLLGACATVDPAEEWRGFDTSMAKAADGLASADVVFLGEDHSNDAGHRLQHEMVALLHDRRPDLVVSMEMFERDVQGPLDAYLRGDRDEDAFLADSRPWKNYGRHYRPIVEYCKQHSLPVLAANMPRKLAQAVSREGATAARGNPHAAREMTAPEDSYYERFRGAMKDHTAGDGTDKIDLFYQAQCFKDDTMAETIVDYIGKARAAGRRPLVVHLCGKFHSDFGEGTAARVRQRDPTLEMNVVTMKTWPQLTVGGVTTRTERGDFEFAVPAQKPAKKPAKKVEAPVASGPKPGAEQPSGAAAEQPDTGGRPALGFMADYENPDSVIVMMLREGGPAEKAGLRKGDQIVELGGEKIGDMHEYTAVLETLEIGKECSLAVLRAGKRVELRAVVGSR